MFSDKLKALADRMRHAGDEVPPEAAKDLSAMSMALRCLHVGMSSACSGNRDATFSVQPWRAEVDKRLVADAEAACDILRGDGIGCRVVSRQGKDVVTSAHGDDWEVVIEMTW